MVLNPRVRVRCDGETLWVQTPNPELGLQTFIVSLADDRALFDTILSILTSNAGVAGAPAEPARHDDAVELDDATWRRLNELGAIVPAPGPVPDLAFACEVPRIRDPDAARRARTAHPALVIQRGPALPPDVAVLLRGAALPIVQRFPIAWVTDPVTGVPSPYWLSGRHAAALDGLRAGRPAPGVPDDLRADLAAAEILVGDDFAQRREAEWKTRLRAAHRSFAERGWTIVRGLLPALQLRALRDYIRAYVAAGHARRGDPQMALRWGCHDQHLVTLIHGGLNRVVARVVGCATKASYSYLASYRPGALLLRQRDRSQCKYSVSLQLDAAPDDGVPWPLCFEDLRGEQTAALLAPGDGLFYRGCDLTHWRDELPAGRTSTSAFLHYVDLDVAGALA
jgi:hypothetical protein